MSNKELQTQAAKELATMGTNAFGATSDMVSAQDLIIAKMLLMQANAKLVIEENVAKYGDVVDSVTKEVKANLLESSIELIPFYLHKVWAITEDKEKGEFIRYEDVTKLNENAPIKDMEEGKPIKRQLHRNFYCIDPTNPELPVILPLKGVSARAGKQLATLMYVQNVSAGLMPPSYHITVTSEKVKIDNDMFLSFKIARGSETTDAEMLDCFKWFKAVESGKTKSHEVESAPVETSKEF